MPGARRAVGIGVAVVMSSALGSPFVVKFVVTEIGRATRHNEGALRTVGWCWTGLPFFLLVLLLAARNQSYRLRGRHSWHLLALLAWLGSSALLLPPRTGDLPSQLGGAYSDARFLSFGWATGLLAIFVTVVLGVLGVFAAHLVGDGDKWRFDLIFTALGSLVAVGSAAYAVMAPLP
jgi:hypothetical protein